MDGRVLVSSHVDGVKVMGETDTEYKLMVALSVPKESIKDGVGSLIEQCTIFSFIETDTSIMDDVIHERFEMSPQKSIMVKRQEPKKFSNPNTKVKRRKK